MPLDAHFKQASSFEIDGHSPFLTLLKKLPHVTQADTYDIKEALKRLESNPLFFDAYVASYNGVDFVCSPALSLTKKRQGKDLYIVYSIRNHLITPIYVFDAIKAPSDIHLELRETLGHSYGEKLGAAFSALCLAVIGKL